MSSDETTRVDDRAWWWLFGLGLALLCLPVLVVAWLPFTDLPQHAAQIATARGWFVEGSPYPRLFELNPLTNTVVAYAVGYLLSWVVSVATATKLVVLLALVGVPVASLRLINEVGGDRYWVFATLPAAYGYAMWWGFLNYVVAVPVGLLWIAAAIRYAREPTGRRAFGLFGLGLLTFVSHVLVLAYAGLAAGLVVLLHPGAWRDRMRGALALVAVLPFVVAWWVASNAFLPGTSPVTAPIGDYGLHRAVEVLSFTLGELPSPLPVGVGLALYAALLLTGARPSREAWRWAPFLSALACHFAIPLNLAGTAYLYPRFSVFFVPTLLIALEPRADVSRRRVAPLGLVAALWLTGVAIRMWEYGHESAPARRVLAHAAPGGRMLSLVAPANSRFVPCLPFLHFAQWYQVTGGGVVDFSFAEFFPNRFRYRPGEDPPLPFNVEWNPREFVWSEHGGHLYDYFFVRRPRDSNWNPFVGADSKVELVAQEADFWLYHQRRRDPASAPDSAPRAP